MASVGLCLRDLREVQLHLRPEALRVVEDLLPAAEMGQLARDHLRERIVYGLKKTHVLGCVNTPRRQEASSHN